MPSPVEFEKPAAPGVTETQRRFDLVGAEWRGSAEVELRARSHTGRWSRWARVHRREPAWAGGSDAVQVRASGPLRGLRLRFVNTTGTATRERRAKTARTTALKGEPGTLPLPSTTAPAPSIVPRAAWGARRCKPRDTPTYGDVQVGFVHHTVSLNGYSRSQAAAVVLGICLFHRNGNGWDDIGYNFLVDRFGRVFEGRGGGIDLPVRGAQAGGFNHGSTGVSLIGNFTSARPSPRAMSSLARLLAWKLPLHGVPVTGTGTVVSAGGPSTPHPAGTPVRLRRISGHRDADSTACPGARLYSMLPALRRRVARLAGTPSAVEFAPSVTRLPYGSALSVAGRLHAAGGAGEQVEIRALYGGRERTVATATTREDGGFDAVVPPLPRTAVLRAVYIGDAAAGKPGASSPVTYVQVAPRIELTADQPTVPAGGTVTVNGTVAPGKRRAVLTLLRDDGGRPRRVARRRVRVTRGSFGTRWQLRRAGTYQVVATVTEDDASAGNRSAPLTVVASEA